MCELPDFGSCFGEENSFVSDNREKRWCLKEGFSEGFKMDGSNCSCFSLFILLVTPLGTAQILQVLEHCPFGHGKISGVFLGRALGPSYSSVRARYLKTFKNLLHGILKIIFPSFPLLQALFMVVTFENGYRTRDSQNSSGASNKRGGT